MRCNPTLAAPVVALSPANRALSPSATLPYAAPMGPVNDDSALMLRYQDGDIAAFETLYRRHKDPLYRYLLRHCRHRAAAEDVFQEVWGKLIKARSNYRPSARFTTFLYRVAHNCFIDYLRRNTRHQQTADIDVDEQAAISVSPEEATEKELAKRAMSSALATLPNEQRDAFLLHEEAGLSLEQIATVTGVNRETAKSRLRYAVAKLKTAMANELRPAEETL